MSCPKYIDSQRLCIKEIKVLPSDTFEYCITDKYLECPIYIIIEKIGRICEFVRGCKVFQHLQVKDFYEFVKITNKYCLSDNNVKCKRYILKKLNEDVPSHLHPDGRIIQDWCEEEIVKKDCICSKKRGKDAVS